MSTVLEFAPPAIRRGEILRYAGVREETPEIAALLDACLAEVGDAIRCKVAFTEVYPIFEEWAMDIGFARVESLDLMRSLAGADGVLVFCATVGIGIDRLIARYARIFPAKALLLEAIGNERVESLCDAFCAAQNACTRRFSPGYGDLPLSLQRELLQALDCPRQIGVHLGESLLMTPQKSVTAFVGIKK